MKSLLFVVFVLSFGGCALDEYRQGAMERPDFYHQRMSGTYLSKQAQIAEEDLKLKSLYRKCIEDNYGKPEQIKSVCEPIIEPLRISSEFNPKGTRSA